MLNKMPELGDDVDVISSGKVRSGHRGGGPTSDLVLPAASGTMRLLVCILVSGPVELCTFSYWLRPWSLLLPIYLVWVRKGDQSDHWVTLLLISRGDRLCHDPKMVSMNLIRPCLVLRGHLLHLCSYLCSFRLVCL